MNQKTSTSVAEYVNFLKNKNRFSSCDVELQFDVPCPVGIARSRPEQRLTFREEALGRAHEP